MAVQVFRLAAVAFATLPSALAAPGDIRSLFQGKLTPGSSIYVPTDANYTEDVTQRWQTYAVPTYKGAVKPALPCDVQEVVKIASEHKIPFLATAGGHGLPITLEKLQNGLEIDMSYFRGNFSIDTQKNTIKMGGGTKYGDVIEPLFKLGKQMPIGGCPCVGFMGGGIGGGLNHWQGFFGLGVDNVIELEVVTASGDLVTVSETSNPELFWAMKGAGANFGIIVSGTFKIYDLLNDGKALNADFYFPAEKNASHWELLTRYQENMPQGLAFLSTVNYNPEQGGINILFNVLYTGPEEEGRRLVQPFVDNGPTRQNISYVPTDAVDDVAAFGLFGGTQCIKGNPVNSYTVGVKTLDVATMTEHFNNFSQMYKDYPATQKSTVVVEGLPLQAVNAVPANSTSYHSRAITNHLLWGYHYDPKN